MSTLRGEQIYLKKINKNRITKIIILIFLLFAPLFIFSISNHNQRRDSEFSFETNKDPLKYIEGIKEAKISDSIYIDDSATGIDAHNWTWANNSGLCSGYGNSTHPYIIEDLVIDNQQTNSCIWIENSDKHFIIRNCTLFNSNRTVSAWHGGIKLENVINGQIIDNDCSNNLNGIITRTSCYNITIRGNELNDNEDYGLVLRGFDNGTISGNTINLNNDGLLLEGRNNTIFNNNFNSNKGYGIYSRGPQNNTFSSNILYNCGTGFRLEYSENSSILGNKIKYSAFGIQLVGTNNTIVNDNIIWYTVSCIIFEGTCINNEFDNNQCVLITIDDDDDEEDRKKDSFNILPLIILGSLICVGGFSSTIFIFRKVKKRKSTKGAKKKYSSAEILKSIFNKTELLRKFDLDEPIKDPLTTIDIGFLEKANQIGFSKKEMRDFIKEMLSVSPKERMEIVENILKRKER
ncbi:MAG: hypothetical protein GF383_11450 [Candidatus Lokiarchaeota archaeon]|nr:hypothetical protein [Candidatus Lokiarchaeota archaeon]MBD3341339.1 hypothetical protein [Candidatus Lokiarchaeota archaeon]